MRLDLHLHTNASDGAWPPARVVEAAAEGGLDVIALTDHDTTASVAAARGAAAEKPIEVIAGIEVSTTWEGREVHVLGYFVDPEAPGLVEHRMRALTRRVERMKEMIARLAREGVHVRYEDVVAAAGPDADVIARPHLARALVEGGHASSVADAFGRHIGDDRAAFVPTELGTPARGVELVLGAGGIPSWAHPPGDLLEELLPGLVEAGLRGLEVYRPAHRRHDVLRLEAAAHGHGLLLTGGSDWHSPDGGTALGDFFVTAEEVAAFLEAGGM